MLLIRRNNGSNTTYQELKQYPFFKQLSKCNDVLILKQILPMVVIKVSLDTAKQCYNPDKMMCIKQQTNLGMGLESGAVTSVSVTTRQIKSDTKTKFLMMQTKIYHILKYLYSKDIKCLEHLKSFAKLNFFYRCDLNEVPFGSYIYRRQDQIQSVFYLVRGQIKIKRLIDQKEIPICTLNEGSFFGTYEFEEYKTKRVMNAQSHSNDTLVLTISLDLLGQLFGKQQEQFVRNILKLPSEKDKINKGMKLKKIAKQFQSKNTFAKGRFSQQSLTANEFHKRSTKFYKDRLMGKASTQCAFNKFLQDKSLLFKIRDSNIAMSSQKKQAVVITTNFHKTEASIKYYQRLGKCRLDNIATTRLKSRQNRQLNRQMQQRSKGNNASFLTDRLRQRFEKTRNSHKFQKSLFNGQNEHHNHQHHQHHQHPID